LPILLDGSTKNGQKNLFASASLDNRAGEVVLKMVNAAPSSREVNINLAGVKNIKKAGQAYVLSSDLKAENSLEEPRRVAPVEQPLVVPSNEFGFTLAPHSLTVLRIGSSTR
jgi:alpha-N-arabinofuranosidase